MFIQIIIGGVNEMPLEKKIRRYHIMNHYQTAVRKGDYYTAKKLLYLLITGHCVLLARHWAAEIILAENGCGIRIDKYGLHHAYL